MSRKANAVSDGPLTIGQLVHGSDATRVTRCARQRLGASQPSGNCRIGAPLIDRRTVSGAAMTIRLHRGDLPDLARYQGGAVAIDTETMGLDVAARPAVRGAALARRRLRRRGADAAGRGRRDRTSRRCWPTPASSSCSISAVSISATLYQAFGVMAGAGLLHQDRLAAGPHLHRQARPQGPGARAARGRPVEAAAALRLGRRRADRGPGRLCGLRRAAPACAARRSSTPCWPARAATELAAACFRFLPDRVRLDLAGWAAEDIFSHS